MNITLWFPTCIYSAEDIISNEENTFLINELIDVKNNIPKGEEGWRTDVYNTIGTFDLTKNIKFNNLSKNIILHTQNFAKELGSNDEYIIKILQNVPNSIIVFTEFIFPDKTSHLPGHFWRLKCKGF